MATKPPGSKPAKPSRDDGISISVAQDSLGALLNRVEIAREEITIVKGKNRRPVARLVPIAEAS